MGLFSFVTSDTRKSIPVDADNPDNPHPPFTVYMMSPGGDVWTEENYEGYGLFGGKDIHALLAELNWPEECLDPDEVGVERANDNNRMVFFNKPFFTHEAPNVHCQGCFDYYEKQLGLTTPKLSENPPIPITSYLILDPTTGCPHQGYFYPGRIKEYEEDLRSSACHNHHPSPSG